MIDLITFNKFSQRDYTGSSKDVYAQLLSTLHHHLWCSGEIEKFYELLEKAEKQNKQIALKTNSIDQDEYFFDDLVLVENF